MARIIPAFEQFLDDEGNPIINGYLQFLVSGTNNTDKITYADAAQTIKNPNPVPLDASGRLEFSVFGEGTYRVIPFLENGQQMEYQDPVGGIVNNGPFSDWVASTIYNIPDVTRGKDGQFYRTFVDNNQGVDPMPGSEVWELLQFGRVWNNDNTYSDTDTVYGSDGKSYISVTNDNTGNNPVTDDGSNWTSEAGLSGGGQQLNYSDDVAIPLGNKVITLNPSATGLLATFTTDDTGDIKRLINISQHTATVNLSGTGFVEILTGNMIFAMRVGVDWFVVESATSFIPNSYIRFEDGAVFNTATTNSVSVAMLTDSTVVAAYADGGNSNAGTAIVGIITEGVVVFGGGFVFDSGATTGARSITALDDTTFIITYEDEGAALDHGTCIAGSVAGSVITYGTKSAFDATGNTVIFDTVKLDATHLAIVYETSVGPSAYQIIAEISGLVLSFGSRLLVNPGTNEHIKPTKGLVALSPTKIALFYEYNVADSAARMNISTITGTSIAMETQQTFAGDDPSDITAAAITTTQAVVSFKSGSSGLGTSILVDIPALTATFSDTFLYSDSKTVSLQTSTSLDSNKIATIYLADGEQWIVTGQISASSGKMLYTAPSLYKSGSSSGDIDSAGNVVSIAYSDDDNSDFGTVAIGQIIDDGNGSGGGPGGGGSGSGQTSTPWIVDNVAALKLLTPVVGDVVDTKGWSVLWFGAARYTAVLSVSVANDNIRSFQTLNPDVSFLYSPDVIELDALGFGTGMPGNNTAFLTAIEMVRESKAAGSSGTRCVFPGGDYEMSGYYLIPPYMRIAVKGAVIIRHTGGVSFLHVSYDSDIDPQASSPGLGQNPFNIGHIIDGSNGSLSIRGDGTAGSVGIELGLRNGNASNTAHTAWMSFSHVYLDNFETSHLYNNINTYLIRWFNCVFTGCGDIIGSVSGSNINSGEQINYVSCGLHNSNRIAWLRSQMSLEFTGCSIDYMTGDQGFLVDVDFMRLSFIGGWVEAFNSTENGVLVTANTGALADRLHVNINGVYIQPRDKKQAALITGPCTVSFTNNSIVVNRFNNFPESAVGKNHYLFGDDVILSESRGNKWFDQMMSLHANNGTRNPEFTIDALGTVGGELSTAAITGWTLRNIPGQCDCEVVSIAESPEPSGRSLKLKSSTGNFCDMTSDKIPVIAGSNVYLSLAMYSPLDNSINTTFKIIYYNSSGTLIDEKTLVADYNDYPSNIFVTNKSSLSSKVPAGSALAEVQIVIGGFSNDIYIYGAGLQLI